MDRVSDAELAEASRGGDRAAFGELVERCARMIAAVSYAATRDHVLSEDLTQDTFVAAWRDLARLRDVNAVRPWLCSIARQLAHKARRRRDREVITDTAELAGEHTPFDVLAETEAEHVVRAALARVPDAYREALVLFYYEEQSAKDVALALGLTEEVVHKRLSRGRRFLAEGIERLVENALTRRRPHRDVVAGVLAALPVALAAAPSDAAPKRANAWKLAALGIVAVTVAVGTAASRPPRDRARAVAATASSGSRDPADSNRAERERADRERTDRERADRANRAAESHGDSPRAQPQLAKSAVVTAADDTAADPPLTCAVAARHTIDLAEATSEVIDPAGLTRLVEQQCREDKLSRRELECIVEADDLAAAEACKTPRPLGAPTLAPPGSEISCRAVAEHMLAASPPDPHDDRPEAQYASLLADLVHLCTIEAWSEQRRRCTLAASNGRMMARCLDVDSEPAMVPGGVDAGCAAVGRHVASLLASDMREAAPLLGGADAIPDTTRDRSDHIEAVCTEEQWPEPHRRCLLAATSTTAFMSCRVKAQ